LADVQLADSLVIGIALAFTLLKGDDERTIKLANAT